MDFGNKSKSPVPLAGPDKYLQLRDPLYPLKLRKHPQSLYKPIPSSLLPSQDAVVTFVNDYRVLTSICSLHSSPTALVGIN